MKLSRRRNPRGGGDLAVLGIGGGRKLMWWNPSPINRVRERAQVQSPWSYVTRDGCDGLVWVVHVVGSAGARIGLGVWDTMSAPEYIYI
jgi:hypothetical protein